MRGRARQPTANGFVHVLQSNGSSESLNGVTTVLSQLTLPWFANIPEVKKTRRETNITLAQSQCHPMLTR